MCTFYVYAYKCTSAIAYLQVYARKCTPASIRLQVCVCKCTTACVCLLMYAYMDTHSRVRMRYENVCVYMAELFLCHNILTVKDTVSLLLWNMANR